VARGGATLESLKRRIIFVRFDRDQMISFPGQSDDLIKNESP